ncbi:hypothetical protein Cfor_09688, partial [Coptotermes formosanus]
MQRNVNCLQQREVWSEENEKMIHRVYQNRMQTTYQISYCKRHNESIGEEGPDDEVEDVFLQEMENYYVRPAEKTVPPALPSTKRVFAYSRPAFFRTGMSEYGDNIGRLAYNISKRNMVIGGSRLKQYYKRTTAGTTASHSTQPPDVPPVKRHTLLASKQQTTDYR